MERMILRLIDPDIRRRAELTSALSDGRLRVEPYESVAELKSYWPADGLVMVHDGDGLLAGVFAAMTDAGRWLPVVAYAQQPQVEAVVAALGLGALDYLAWPAPRDEVSQRLAAIDLSSRQQAERQRGMAEARARVRGLSGREKEVLRDLARGLSNKEIAMNLGISPRTVEIHRANLIGKIGATSSAQAIRIAVQSGID